MATYILVPGAGCDPQYWYLLVAELRQREHDAVAVDLPCDDDSAGLAEYVDAVVEAVGASTDVIRVAHSFVCVPHGWGGGKSPSTLSVGASMLARMFEKSSRGRGFVPQPGFVVQAYRFALDPSPAQVEALASHCGAARAAFNWAVARVRANWFQRSAEASYGIPEADRTPWVEWSLPGLRKAFNQQKHNDPRFAGWWQENSKEAYSSGLANANAAFGNHTRSKRGERKGKRVGLPRFKRKSRTTPSCRFTTGAIRVEPDRRHVTLPRLGTIKTHEPTRKLERRIADGRARILSATVKYTRGRWFVSFQAEVQRAQHTPTRPEVAVGVDLGVKHLAVLADSAGRVRFVPNPKHLDASLKDLRRANRRLARRHGPTVVDPTTGNTTRRTPSKRWEEAKQAVQKVHARVANQRQDALHKLTTKIAGEYGHVVVEDLHVAGMLRNRRLARAISSASFAEIRRQITYKTSWNHGTLHIADRWYPSSKTCSNCKAVKASLPLHIRVFDCDECPLVMDRDENAARNLAALAANCLTGTAVGGDRDTHSVSKPRRADVQTRRNQPEQSARGWAGSRRNPAPADRNERPSTGHPSRYASVTPSRTLPPERTGLLRAAETQGNGYSPNDVNAMFYADLPAELAAEAMTWERDQSGTPFEKPWPRGTWPDVPTRFLLCRDDRFFPAEFMRRVVHERLGITPDEVPPAVTW